MNIDSKWSDQEWFTFKDWLSGILKTEVVTVKFLKKDGTDRVMKCTLIPEKLPKKEVKENKEPRKVSEDTLSVFDVEKKAWRSFIVKSVKEISFTLGDEND